MSDAVAVALISGGLALLGVIITSISTSRRMTAQLERNQAVTDTKIEELTREVRLHNNFAQRIPVIERDIKVINHRIDDLENITKEYKIMKINLKQRFKNKTFVVSLATLI